MVKNKHSIIRMLEVMLILLLIVSVLIAYNSSLAFAADSIENTSESGDVPTGPEDPDEPGDPDDPLGPDDPPGPDNPPEPELKDIEGAVITLSPDGFAYLGEPVIPEVTVTYEDTVLEEGIDYNLEITNNEEPGEGSVKVTGIGSYTGEATLTFMIVKGGWLLKGGKWYYIDTNGNYAVNTWKKDSRGWCWLGGDGAMATNRWVDYYRNWYYIDSNGYMAANRWQKDSAGWCYLGSDGKMLANKWVKTSGYWYYLKSDGHMAGNMWVEDSAGWCYVGSDGKMVTGKWLKSSGYWYYLNYDGHMATNMWEKDSAGWCYLGKDGKMVTRYWVQSGKNWYYLKADGHMAASEWVHYGNNWYWMNGNGAMAYGKWQKIKDCWYYFYSDGCLETKPYVFISISEQTLYYCNNGSLVLSTPVVTGALFPNDHSTPKGTFYINNKARNMHLKGYEDDGEPYDSFVSYWMPFIGGEYGLHDANWRYYFGGDIYKYNGSHGCVNMPVDAARRLYGLISVGTMVRIQ